MQEAGPTHARLSMAVSSRSLRETGIMRTRRNPSLDGEAYTTIQDDGDGAGLPSQKNHETPISIMMARRQYDERIDSRSV